MVVAGTGSTETAESVLSFVKDLTARREDRQALRMLQSLAPAEKERRDVALVARDIYMRLGELSPALGEINRVLRHDSDVRLRRQARHLLGRIRETESGWMPDTGELKPWTPEARTVLHLLKESLPYVESGFTIRSRMTLRAQTKSGFRPVVVTSLGFPRTQGIHQFPISEDVDGVAHFRLDPGPDVDTRSTPFDLLIDEQTRRTAAIAAELRPAVIQAGSGFRGYDTALPGLTIAAKSGLPFVYEVRGFQEQTWTSDVERSERGEYYRRRRAQELRCLRAADAIITIAEAMKVDIIGRGISADKVHLVPNAVDVDRFAPRPKDPRLAETLGLTGRNVIGYVSNLGWREGLTHLIRATDLLRKGGHDVACLIVGDGPEKLILQKLIAELGLEGHVVLTGHVANKDIVDYYALIDVFVVPRLADRASRLVTPLKPLEAMAMGLPVVASDLPALREIALPGERGISFHPADPQDLARAVGEVLDDVTLRRRLSLNGRDWVVSERSLESMSQRYQTVLSTLL